MKKDAVITIRLPRPTRRRIEDLARREGRSLSRQVERLIERGMTAEGAARAEMEVGGARPLTGLLKGGQVPAFREFRAIRTLLSASLARRAGTRAQSRR